VFCSALFCVVIERSSYKWTGADSCRVRSIGGGVEGVITHSPSCQMLGDRPQPPSSFSAPAPNRKVHLPDLHHLQIFYWVWHVCLMPHFCSPPTRFVTLSHLTYYLPCIVVYDHPRSGVVYNFDHVCLFVVILTLMQVLVAGNLNMIMMMTLNLQVWVYLYHYACI